MKISKLKVELAMATNCKSFEELSLETGISKVTISRLRKGTQNPRPATVGRIAKALGCKVEDIIDQ